MDGDTIQPRPIPRPRRNVQQKVPQEEQVKKYENVSMDSGQTIFNITEKSDDVGKKEKNVDELDNPYRNVITEMNNLNLELNKTTEKQMLMESSAVSNEDLRKPIPAPRRNQHPTGEKETGAVSKKPTRKAPGLPTKESQDTPIRPARRNSRENSNTKLYPDLEMDNRSLEKSPSSSTLNSSHSSNDNLTKFKTSSPG